MRHDDPVSKYPHARMETGVDTRQDYVIVQGERVAFTSAGEGDDSVVMVHGGAGDRYDWDANVAALAAHHWVYAPDLIGFGDSVRSQKTPYTIRQFSDFLRDFVGALGIERAYFVGHSLGARVCLELARRETNMVKGMVLIAPLGFGKMTLKGRLTVDLIRMGLKILGHPLPYPRMDIHLVDPDIDAISGVPTPTLVIWGGRDQYFPSSHASRVLEILPNSRLELLPRCGHAPHKESPPEFNRIVADFLSSVDS